MSRSIICKTCGQPHSFDGGMQSIPRGSRATCAKCGAVLQKRSTHSLQKTAAFSIAALLLYVPANLYPVLYLDLYGAKSENTVLQSCTRLYDDGQPLVAFIVFMASMVVPLFKLLGLLILVSTTGAKSPHNRALRTMLYKVIAAVGPWAMLDVFIGAILVALVKLNQLATIMPGRGLLAFTGVVVFTILASSSFDSELIWQDADSK